MSTNSQPIQQSKTLQEIVKEIDVNKILTNIKLDNKAEYIIKKIVERCINMNIDWFIIIAGGEGIGKTTLALNIYAEICKLLNLNPVQTLIETLIYDEDEMLEYITKLDPDKRYLPMLLDEGANILFNRDSMQKHRAYILKLINVMRFLNNIVIISTPNFAFLDKNIREHRAKSLIYIEKRGIYWYYNKKQIDKMLNIQTRKRWVWIEPMFIGRFGVNEELEKLTVFIKKEYIRRFSKKVDKFIHKNRKDTETEQSETDALPTETIPLSSNFQQTDNEQENEQEYIQEIVNNKYNGDNK